MRDDVIRNAIAFVTSAFGSYSGCRQYAEDVSRARAEVGEGAPEIARIRPFSAHPAFIEAMALGRPLVATDVSPVLEITDGGIVARICRIGDPDDLANQILDVERDWTRSRSLVAAARERMVHMFSPEHMVAEYLDCLGLEFPA